jgi:hypothetical protein
MTLWACVIYDKYVERLTIVAKLLTDLNVQILGTLPRPAYKHEVL